MTVSKVFPARYPGTCKICGGRFSVGSSIRTSTQTGGTFHELCTPVAKAPVAKADPLVAAVIAREVAEDDYFAAVYFLNDPTDPSGHNGDLVRKFLQAMIDARMAALLEADAAGLINMFDPIAEGETIVDRTRQTLRFVGTEDDIHAAAAAEQDEFNRRWVEQKNEFGRYEAEQEEAAYLSNPV